MATDWKPEGYHTVTPYLIVDDAEAVIAFAREAFGAQQLFRMDNADGTLMHGEILLGDSRIMMGQANEEYPAQPAVLYVYVENVDEVYRQAVAAGGTSVMEPEDQFWGDRNAGVRDGSGNQWWISTHVEDVPPEEIERRQAQQKAASGEAAPA
jgi:PhnB protein